MVWVLAWRWRMRRSVKKACRVAQIVVMSGRPLSGQGGGRLRRAVRVRHANTRRCRRLDVAEERRQQRQPGGHVTAVAVPADEGLHRQRVSEVMNPRPATQRTG